MTMEYIARMWMYIVSAACLLFARGTLSQYIPQEQGLRDYCEGQTFEAKCAQDEIVIMGEALYGRMRSGSCLGDAGNMGCHTDVLGLFDLWCSGQHECEIRVSSIIDSIDENEQPCSKDFRSYLQASFTCVKAIRTAHDKCISVSQAEVTESSGYLASVITDETTCGSFDTPWVLKMGQGQTIDVELYDFAAASGRAIGGGDGFSSNVPNVCHVYAVIKEQGGMASETICSSSTRRNIVYSSMTNQLEIRLVSNRKREGYFMLKYTAKGCADPAQPAYGWVQRQQDRAIMGCNASSDTWSVTCDDNVWGGDYVNCSHVASGGKEGAIIGLFTGSQWASIVIILAIAVTLGLIIFLFGLVFLRRRRNLQGRLGATGRDRPLPPDMYSTQYRDVSAPYGTKPLSAMDCSNSENDYYRTWQLQRHPPGVRLMPSAGAHGNFASAAASEDMAERGHHPAGTVCTNPHCAQRPYDTMVDSERRYPMDHIYESPKFDRKEVRLPPPPPQNQTSNSTTGSSTQYFELDPEEV